METQILRSKLFIPAERKGLINRAELLARMDEGLQPGVKLILLCAPAGFGKTTLAREWISELEIKQQRENYQICWLTLDEGDDDVRSFLRYLIAALRQIFETTWNVTLEWFKMPIKEVRDQVLAGLTNDLATYDQPLFIFLDDYHFIESDEVHHCLGFLLDHLPPHIHLVIMTRSNPPFPLSRMRASGQLIEIRSADLRFNKDEIEVLFNHVMRYQLNDNQIAAVEQRTEGWITALQLLALSLQGKDNQADLIEAFTGSNRYILDYLLEETLAQLPEDIQDFLLITSILGRLRAELCDEVTRRSDSRAILERLENANLFLVPLDDERIWFRYHLLFGEFLRNRLRNRSEEGALERKQVYHRRAADWLYEHNYLTEAIDHAFLADDKVWAADIIEESTRTLYLPGEYGLMLKWLERLPQSYLLSRPRLCMAYAWALLMSGRFLDIEKYIDAITKNTSPLDAEVAGEAATLQTLLSAYRMDISIAIASANEALALLPEQNIFLRSLAYHNLGVAYEFMDEQELAFQAYENGWHLAKKIDSAIIKILPGTQLGDIRLLQGRLHDAEDYYNALLDELSENEKKLPLAAMVFLGLTRLYYEWNRIDKAEQFLQKSLELSSKWESVEFFIIGRLYSIKIAYARGDRDQVEMILDQIDATPFDPILSPMIKDYVMMLLIQYWIELGNIEKASMHLDEVHLSHEKYPSYITDLETISRARLYIAQGEPEQATLILEDAIPIVEQTTKVLVLIGMLIINAVAWRLLGDVPRACDILTKALSLAGNESISRVFLDEGKSLLDLMIEMRTRGLLGRFGAELLGLLEKECQAVQGGSLEKTLSSLNTFEPLSEREIEVLDLLAQGYSNKQIADRLFVALSTVKTHVGNIYAKLGVTSRVQAAARAREWHR